MSQAHVAGNTLSCLGTNCCYPWQKSIPNKLMVCVTGAASPLQTENNITITLKVKTN